MTESNVCGYQCHLQETELSKIHSDVSNIRVKERMSMNNCAHSMLLPSLYETGTASDSKAR